MHAEIVTIADGSENLALADGQLTDAALDNVTGGNRVVIWIAKKVGGAIATHYVTKAVVAGATAAGEAILAYPKAVAKAAGSPPR